VSMARSRVALLPPSMLGGLTERDGVLTEQPVDAAAGRTAGTEVAVSSPVARRLLSETDHPRWRRGLPIRGLLAMLLAVSSGGYCPVSRRCGARRSAGRKGMQRGYWHLSRVR
jgi:hypothetical protein